MKTTMDEYSFVLVSGESVIEGSTFEMALGPTGKFAVKVPIGQKDKLGLQNVDMYCTTFTRNELLEFIATLEKLAERMPG